ncbi:MAG: RHS repeat-associated core domain-containing protein [Bacteroidales bacterium]|nr:RHS repeat-associated core domain-containing protein [Bacteroidales bacterium]
MGRKDSGFGVNRKNITFAKMKTTKANLTLNERYFDELLMQNGKVRRLQHADGFINLSQDSTPVEYFYYLKDHLGNVRATLRNNSLSGLTVMQANDYYPFGMSYTPRQTGPQTSAFNNKYKYNGKEEQEVPGGWLDYGFRMYDPALARWHVPDPMSEKYFSLSPHNYALNNPILFIDPDGRDVGLGNLYDKDDKDNYLYMTQILALELFALTKDGQTFLKDRAQEGFKFEAVFIKEASFEVDKAGSLSGDINANFEVTDLSDKAGGIGADGNTKTEITGEGKLNITYQLDKNLGDIKSPLKDPQNEYVMLNSINTVFHEVFIHGYFKEKNYKEGKYNGITGKVSPNGGYEHNNIDKTPYKGKAYPALSTFNKILNLGTTDEKIWYKYISH